MTLKRSWKKSNSFDLEEVFKPNNTNKETVPPDDDDDDDDNDGDDDDDDNNLIGEIINKSSLWC